MSWAHGIDKYGREVGYSILTTCKHEGCGRGIDKGVGYRCGGTTNLTEDCGCGEFFCGDHLYINMKDQLCPKCYYKEAP